MGRGCEGPGSLNPTFPGDGIQIQNTHNQEWGMHILSLRGSSVNKLSYISSFIFFNLKLNKFYLGRKFTKNMKIFIQQYMIKTILLTCHQDLVKGGCYFTLGQDCY